MKTRSISNVALIIGRVNDLANLNKFNVIENLIRDAHNNDFMYKLSMLRSTLSMLIRNKIDRQVWIELRDNARQDPYVLDRDEEKILQGLLEIE